MSFALGGEASRGAICDPDELKENFKMNWIPGGMEERELGITMIFLKSAGS